MIRVVDKGTKWIVIRDNETIVIYKNKDVAIYGKNGRVRVMGYGEELRKYMDAEITDELFNMMKDYIFKNSFLW